VRNVRFHPAARAEFNEAVGYLEDQRSGYGALFKQEIRSDCRELARDPERWPVREKGFRKKLVEKFNYLIWYRESDEEIYVIAVHHCSRKPGYWKKRILDEQR
jgi:plasmid stabilization system protein ParE